MNTPLAGSPNPEPDGGGSNLRVDGDAFFVNDGTTFQGNIYNGFELGGSQATFSSIAGEITRVSYLDPDGDLVFVEFGSEDPGTTLTVNLANAQEDVASPYNQADVTYTQGLASFSINNPTDLTFFSIFSLGNDPDRVDLTLINDDTFTGNVDGIADVKLLSVLGDAGGGSEIAGINAANANFIDSSGIIGIDAEDVAVTDFLFIGDLTPSDDARPWIRVSADSTIDELRITGGDLAEARGIRQINTNGVVYTFPFNAADGQRSISDSPFREDLGDGALRAVTDTFAEGVNFFFITNGQTGGVSDD